MEKQLANQIHYRDAIWAVDPGASNLSGLARSLPGLLTAVEQEVGEVDAVVRESVDWLNTVIDIGMRYNPGASTGHMNTLPNVKEAVRTLTNYAFEIDTMRRVAAHPIMRLVIDQMRALASVPMPDNPDYTQIWFESYNICKHRMSRSDE